MPTFQYKAAYSSGETVTGVVEALTKADAVAQIRQNCDVVLSLKEVPKFAVRGGPRHFVKISPKSLCLVCRQFAIILRSGLPLVQAVDLVAGQCADKALSKILSQAAEDVNNGWSLSYSFDQRGGGLPVTFRETIRAGEESGDLVSAFQRMSAYYDRTSKTQAKAISTMTYPAFLMVVAVVVVVVIMTFAVPSFTQTFADLDLELPLVTRALIGVSEFMQQWWLALLLGVLLVVCALTAYSRTERGGLHMSRLRLSLPIVGEIARMNGASQFAHTMSAMLAAGMPILRAIDVAGRTISNLAMAQEVASTMPGVEGGKSLGECMQTQGRELPKMLIEMTVVGESSGSLESTLEVLAEYYDNEVAVRTERALSLLEPAIICVMAVFVVFILFAVYLPLFSMYGSI